MSEPRILYCQCAYARVVPDDVKQGVLRGLSESSCSFDAVADLCELSAKADPCLKELAAVPQLQIAACYPRAVKWLFAAGGAPLPGDAQVLNMRVQSASEIVSCLVGDAGEDDSLEEEGLLA